MASAEAEQLILSPPSIRLQVATNSSVLGGPCRTVPFTPVSLCVMRKPQYPPIFSQHS